MATKLGYEVLAAAPSALTVVQEEEGIDAPEPGSLSLRSFACLHTVGTIIARFVADFDSGKLVDQEEAKRLLQLLACGRDSQTEHTYGFDYTPARARLEASAKATILASASLASLHDPGMLLELCGATKGMDVRTDRDNRHKFAVLALATYVYEWCSTSAGEVYALGKKLHERLVKVGNTKLASQQQEMNKAHHEEFMDSIAAHVVHATREWHYSDLIRGLRNIRTNAGTVLHEPLDDLLVRLYGR